MKTQRDPVTLRTTLTLIAVITLMAPVAMAQVTPPMHWDFETEATCATGCGAACVLLGDWQNLPAIDAADDLDWIADSGGTSSSATGPSVDHDPGTVDGIYLYVESSCDGTGFPDKTAKLVSPVIDLSGGELTELSFWYHLFGAAVGTSMHVDVDVLGDQLYLDVVPSWTDNQDLWQEKVIDLSAYAGEQIQVIIRGITGSSFTSDMAIDNISLTELVDYDVGVTSLDSPVGGCGLTANEIITVTVENFGTLDQSGFAISYVLDGDPAVVDTFTDTIVAGSTASFSFAVPADLSLPGSHTIDVATDLPLDEVPANDGISVPLEVVPTFYPPYFEDFESGEAGWVASGSNSTWAFGTPAKTVIVGAASGVNAWVNGGLDGQYAPSEQSQVTSPCFDFSALTNPAVELSVWWETEFSWDGAALQTSIDGGGTWQSVGAFGDPDNWYTDNTINGAPGGQQEGWSGREDTTNGSGGWVVASHLLDGLAGAPGVILRVAFGSDGSVVDEGFAFDDIYIYDVVPDLVLAKSDGGVTTVPGGTINYTLDASNDGALDAAGVVLTETVPVYTTFNDGASTPGWTCLPNNSAGSTCTFAVGPLAIGGSASVVFSVDVDPSLPSGVTLISNSASIADDGSGGPDGNPGDNTASEDTVVDAAPDFQLTKDDGGVVATSGATLLYGLTVGNFGSQDANGVVLIETVPAHTTFDAAASTPGWACVPDGSPGSVCTLGIGSLLVGGAAPTVGFAVTVDDPLPGDVFSIDNCATVIDDGANGPDPTPEDATSCTITSTPFAAILIDGFESSDTSAWSSDYP